MSQRAVLTVIGGPNAGDTLSLDRGTCRLVGRHLSEAETAMIDRDGNRILDAGASDILTSNLKEKAPAVGATPNADFTGQSFERGPDIIFSDDSISRAHAMVFFDDGGLGVIDLASTNGTFLNDERITSAVIEAGKRITIGKSDLLISYE